MAAELDYYELAHREEGVDSGFRYKTVPHVTLKSMANNPEIREGMACEQIEAAIGRYADHEMWSPSANGMTTCKAASGAIVFNTGTARDGSL
jgi:hypothetical protein